MNEYLKCVETVTSNFVEVRITEALDFDESYCDSVIIL